MKNKGIELTRVATILELLIEKHGFAFEYNRFSGYLPNITRMCDDYVRVSIHGNCDFRDEHGTHRITAQASVCQMNPNSDTDELRRAAKQIERGADLVDAINALELKYTES